MRQTLPARTRSCGGGLPASRAAGAAPQQLRGSRPPARRQQARWASAAARHSLVRLAGARAHALHRHLRAALAVPQAAQQRRQLLLHPAQADGPLLKRAGCGGPGAAAEDGLGRARSARASREGVPSRGGQAAPARAPHPEAQHAKLARSPCAGSLPAGCTGCAASTPEAAAPAFHSDAPLDACVSVCCCCCASSSVSRCGSHGRAGVEVPWRGTMARQPAEGGRCGRSACEQRRCHPPDPASAPWARVAAPLPLRWPPSSCSSARPGDGTGGGRRVEAGGEQQAASSRQQAAEGEWGRVASNRQRKASGAGWRAAGSGRRVEQGGEQQAASSRQRAAGGGSGGGALEPPLLQCARRVGPHLAGALLLQLCLGRLLPAHCFAVAFTRVDGELAGWGWAAGDLRWLLHIACERPLAAVRPSGSWQLGGGAQRSAAAATRCFDLQGARPRLKLAPLRLRSCALFNSPLARSRGPRNPNPRPTAGAPPACRPLTAAAGLSHAFGASERAPTSAERPSSRPLTTMAPLGSCRPS